MALKKKFITVEVPILNESLEVLGTLEDLQGRSLKLDLARKLRGKGLELTVQILSKDEKLYGIPRRLELMRFYLLRMMRKRVNYVEDSFEAQCKDVVVTIKPFLITRKKVSRAVRGNLRRTAKEFILTYIKDLTFMQLAELTISGEFQKDMLPKLKKVYPLSFSDLRILETKDLEHAEISFEAPKTNLEDHVEIRKERGIEKEEMTQAEEIEAELKKKKKSEEADEEMTQAEEIEAKESKKAPKKTTKKVAKKE